MANDKITRFDKKIDLYFLLVDIIALIFIQEMENQIIMKRYDPRKGLSGNENKSQVIKIQEQFGHASTENIKKLINNF